MLSPQPVHPQPLPVPLHESELANAALQKQLNAQKKLTIALERRTARSLATIETHLTQLPKSFDDAANWQPNLKLIEIELHQLSDLLADTTVLQKLEAGKVAINLEVIDLQTLLTTVSRHLRSAKDGTLPRLLCKIETGLPAAVADQELTEAVIIDLLARAIKYSDLSSPIVLEALTVGAQIHIRVFAQRFAPTDQGDFAPEIALCCKRIEVQQGKVTCQMHDGLLLVTVALPIAA